MNPKSLQLSVVPLAMVLSFAQPVRATSIEVAGRCGARETPDRETDAEPVAAEPRGELSLRQALGAALLLNPRLAAGSWAARAAEARTLQAGLLPNPTFDVEVENIGGSGERSGVEQTETTVQLSQLVPIGGKVAKRRRVADLRGDLACWDYEVARIDVLTATTKAFVSLLEVQGRLDLLNELEDVARVGVQSLEEQVRAGAASDVAKVRAEVVLLSVQLERLQAERTLEARRFTLAASWAGRTPGFTTIRGDLRRGIVDPPALTQLVARIDSNPDLARWVTELAEREAQLSLAEAMRLPDPTLRLAGRHFSDGNDAALVVGFSLPLPVFDRNQGNAMAAAREIQTARANRASAELAVRAALARRYQDLVAAHAQARALGEQTLPAALRAFQGTSEGYRRGTFRYLDVLDAQRTLYDLRGRELTALSTYHQARADIERLLGEPLDEEGVIQ